MGQGGEVLPRVKLLAGDNRRERVLTLEEETAYLDATAVIRNQIQKNYQQTLRGIRAVKRGQQPRTPDACLLRDIATILSDCGLRPDECFRLRWADNIRDGAIEIHAAKRKGSKCRVPASPRVAYLDGGVPPCWETVKGIPTPFNGVTVIIPVRAPVSVFAAAIQLTGPGPVPVLPETIMSQG
jgi:hypothetical protein